MNITVYIFGLSKSSTLIFILNVNSKRRIHSMQTSFKIPDNFTIFPFSDLQAKMDFFFFFCMCCAVLCLVARSCLTLCDPMDCSLPGSSVHGILQARILELVVMPFPGDVPNPGIEPRSPALQVDSLPSEPKGKPRILEG